MSVVTRFPPSPTGFLHIGGARTALFNWLLAKKNGGEMVLRIEDTDLARSTQNASDVILNAMKWLGLTWDRGPFYQTHRFDQYDAVIQQLLQQGDAYYCACSMERLDAVREQQKAKGKKPKYDGMCRNLGLKLGDSDSLVVRFKNPKTGSVVFDDQIRGRVEIANQELDDLIIARTDGSPTYNLCVVVDDIDMGITYVLRGEDHINNTPRQINIFYALGASLPTFAHMPMILGEDGQRLSKRHGAVSVLEFRDIGVLPEALLNYLVRLGWSHGDQEIFDIDEMIELFEVSAINKSHAAFNMEKLLWVNQLYIAKMDGDRLAFEIIQRLKQRGISLCHGPNIKELVEVMRERAQSLEEMVDKILYFYQEVAQYDEFAIENHINADSEGLLQQAKVAFSEVAWTQEAISQCIKTIVKENRVKFPYLAQPLRIAISGSTATPSIDMTVQLLGREKTIGRIETFIDKLTVSENKD